MNYNQIETKALNLNPEPLSFEEGLFLFNSVGVEKLLNLANRVRFLKIPHKRVSWQIDRNVNYTNVCISGCTFCTFHCKLSDRERAYIISDEELKQKIVETRLKGGDQLLLQGGLHPRLKIDFYENLLKTIKEIDPEIKLNAFGPPEISHIAKVSSLSIEETLTRLIKAGLNTLPGAGAEILSDRVRKILSPGKPTADQWLKVMAIAHKMGIATTATMVYGHIETIAERLEHLIALRTLQYNRPEGTPGFRAFIPWPMQMAGSKVSSVQNLKMIAISRLMLSNIDHIQASWLTMGRDLAKLALHSGADDMGSIMIEENVVSSAGTNHTMDAIEIQNSIREAGFEPWLRSQDYSPRPLPNLSV